MKAILEFNLPDDQEDFKLATDGVKWWSIAWNMTQWLRNEIKFPENMNLSDDELKALEKCSEKLRELIEHHNLDINK